MLPKEVEGIEGHYEIPGFSRYAITHQGQVLNKLTGAHLEGSTNPDGYHNFRLTGDDRHVLTWGRHRLMAFVFKHPGVPVKDLTVNHENGIKGDDWLDNLEWMTYQGNQEHAGREGLTEKCVPISVRNVDTGEVEHFPSFIECARSCGLSKDAINYRAKAGQERVFPERKQYRIRMDNEPWFIPANIDHALMVNSTSKPVKVKFHFTGLEVEFKQMSGLSEYLDTPASTLTLWINKPNQPILPGFIQLKWANDPTPWREVSDPYLEHDLYTGKRSVKVWNTVTNDERIYLSGVECAKAMGVATTALSYRLKSRGAVIYPDGCTYCYYSDSV